MEKKATARRQDQLLIPLRGRSEVTVETTWVKLPFPIAARPPLAHPTNPPFSSSGKMRLTYETEHSSTNPSNLVTKV